MRYSPAASQISNGRCLNAYGEAGDSHPQNVTGQNAPRECADATRTVVFVNQNDPANARLSPDRVTSACGGSASPAYPTSRAPSTPVPDSSAESFSGTSLFVIVTRASGPSRTSPASASRTPASPSPAVTPAGPLTTARSPVPGARTAGAPSTVQLAAAVHGAPSAPHHTKSPAWTPPHIT